jgi:allantoin racemase
LGIGEASFIMADLLGLRFSVITSVVEAVPVIEGNIAALGYSDLRASVRASGLPVLKIDKGAPETIACLAKEIQAAQREDGASCAILGCAGMAPLKKVLEQRTKIPLIDGVAASAFLARAALECIDPRS